MAKFRNDTYVRQMFFRPSQSRSWDDSTTLEPGSVIETENEADIAYLRKLAGPTGPLVEVTE